MTAIPDWTNVTTPEQFLKMPNESTGGWFWAGIDFMVFVIIFITLTGTFGWEAGILAGGFIGILMTVFLAYMDLVSFSFAGYFVAIVSIIIIYIIWSNRYD
jgi:hypothetical protein